MNKYSVEISVSKDVVLEQFSTDELIEYISKNEENRKKFFDSLYPLEVVSLFLDSEGLRKCIGFLVCDDRVRLDVIKNLVDSDENERNVSDFNKENDAYRKAMGL